MASGDTYELVVNQQLNGVPIANVYHFLQTAEAGAGVKPENSLMHAWQDDILPQQQQMSVSDWNMVCFTCRKKNAPAGPRYHLNSSAIGTATGEGLAPGTCCVASWYAGFSNPRMRGRTFLSGLPQTVHNEGRLTSAGMTDLIAWINLLLQAIQWSQDTATFILKIWSAVDQTISNIEQGTARPRLTKLKRRRNRIC